MVMEYVDLIDAEDEAIISYLNVSIDYGLFWPNEFRQDVEARVYNQDPRLYFDTRKPKFLLFVRSRTETCGKTDGCESGCWRIMTRDKLIKSEETGKVIGFKQILKFCAKEKKREEEDQRIWVMEEYRVVNKWKQDDVICRFRLLLQPALSSLLAKHFSFLSRSILLRPISRRSFVPDYELCVPDAQQDEIFLNYLKMMLDNNGSDWPSHFLQGEQVYGVEPWRIVSTDQSALDLQMGRYFFVNRTAICGKTDGCDGGCWRIIGRDKVITSKTNKILGFKKIFKFCDDDKPKPVFMFLANKKENEVKAVTWIMEEYRLAKPRMQDKVICNIKLLFSIPLNDLLQRH